MSDNPEKTDPGPRIVEAIKKGVDAYSGRPMRVAVTWDRNADGGFTIGCPHTFGGMHALQLAGSLGTASPQFVSCQLTWLEHATRRRENVEGESVAEVNAGLAIVEAIAPQDELEAALAVQMAGNHALTMEMLGRAKTSQNTDTMQIYGNLAVKLQRTFTAQVEALARLRGKGQQTVRVEHVTVAPGGQAIVGDVHHYGRGGGGAQEKELQPHGTGKSEASRPMLGKDPTGNGLPIASDAQWAMPPSRRP